MPWANDAQRRACFAKARASLARGVKPKWDCHAFGKHRKTKTGRLSTSGRSAGRLSAIKIGPNGGRYRMYKGRKFYIPKKKTMKKIKKGPRGGRSFLDKGYRVYL